MTQDSPSARKISFELLERISNNGKFSNELIQDSLKKWNLSQKDRALILELVNGTLRWRGQLDWILSKYFRGNFEESPNKLKRILEVSLYQLRFLDKIPEYAAVSEGVKIAKEAGGNSWGRVVNGVLRNYLRKNSTLKLPSIKSNPVSAVSIQYSHPQWLVQRWLDRYGLERTVRLCEYNNRRPAVTLRVNSKKTTRTDLLRELETSGVHAGRSKYFKDFIKVSKPQNVTELPMFHEGYFTVQDESTAIAPLLLAPQKGEVVLDMCAAPGGKACYMAQQVGEGGKVLAVDVNPNRLKLLKENAARLRLKSVHAVVGNSAEIKLSQVDKILLDVPCSGLGVLAKRADLRWKRKPRDILNIRKVQKELLENAARLLKDGGVLVYSTCTLEPEENEELIVEFLDENPNFEIDRSFKSLNETFSSPEGFWRTMPYEHQMDGAFAVRLINFHNTLLIT